MEEALELAERLGARVTLVHVQERRRGLNPEPIFAPPPLEQRGREAYDLAEWTREAEGRLPGRVSSVLLSGDVGTQVAGLARDFNCDVVVMGADGHRGVTRLISSSVAEDIMRSVHCPLLLVQPAIPGGPRATHP